MEKDDKGSTLIRMGVSGWKFLLVPAYPGCPGSKAVKRSSTITGLDDGKIWKADCVNGWSATFAGRPPKLNQIPKNIQKQSFQAGVHIIEPESCCNARDIHVEQWQQQAVTTYVSGWTESVLCHGVLPQPLHSTHSLRHQGLPASRRSLHMQLEQVHTPCTHTTITTCLVW